MKTNEKRTDILLVITKSSWGGAQRYVFDLATNFSKRSEVHVATGGAGGLLISRLKQENINVSIIPSMGRDVSAIRDIKSVFELMSLILKKNPRVVHLNSSKALVVGVIATRISYILKSSRPKIFFTAHGWVFNENRNLFSKFILKFMQWSSLIFVDQIISVSEKTKRDITNWPFIDKKIKTIHNGIKADDIYDQETARNIIDSGDSNSHMLTNIWLGSVSELHDNKGLDQSIEALSKIAKNGLNWHYFILGEGEKKDDLSALISNLGLQSNITLVGFKENASKLLKAFDIFILPSRTEALPYSILEAGIAENAVIASNVGGIPEIIADKISGLLVEPNNPTLLARAIQSLLDKPEDRTAFGKALHRQINEEFSLDKMCEETFRSYSLF